MPKYAKRVEPFGTTIFTEINTLAQQHNATNLGQGKPDFDGPQELVQAAVDALKSGQANQYAPGPGVFELRQAVAEHSAYFYNLDVEPEKGVIVTAGATEGVFSSVMGLVDAGDEVIIIEPFFDSYVPNVLMAGAKPVYVPLRPPSWSFDPDELKKAFNPKTRAIILNTPHNPTGRVFTHEELSLIAELCLEYDVLVISDEVYEHLIFDDAKHIPIASLPDMFERTVTIGSAGKTFGMTGWKIGWVYGHPDLVQGVWRAHQFITFATNHPAQLAVAAGFRYGMSSSYYEDYQALYDHKRQLIVEGLSNAGLKVSAPKGTYFAMADFSDVFDGDDVAFVRYLIEEIGVACIPPTAFFSPAHRAIASKQARFSFCKDDETLKIAAEKLAKLKA
ncbi:MAG: aminotransferase class I/II-fold pyridoxal phosphate-dependent enzyme [Chloroflexi bacterium]|nr:MAG: aminotransferase class I/II-fold pyridoxal phosphate-dependent enzyme [Chloroflexota bacterium]